MTIAAREGRAVTTINFADFEKLALSRKTHPGIIIIPSGGTREEQFTYIVAAADHLRQFPNAMAAACDHIIAVNENMVVSKRLAVKPSEDAAQLAVVPKKA